MRPGHREAQDKFEELGKALGYEPRRTFSAAYPTDGVWFVEDPLVGEVPLVAIEVVVTEGAKSMRGSIATLEAVSPALGIVLLQEEEIYRGLVLVGLHPDEAERHILRVEQCLEEAIRTSSQRIEAWRYSQWVRRHQLVCGTRHHRRVS